MFRISTRKFLKTDFIFNFSFYTSNTILRLPNLFWENFLVDILNTYLEVGNFIIILSHSIITPHRISFYLVHILCSFNKFIMLRHVVQMKEVSSIDSSLHFRIRFFIKYFYVLISTFNTYWRTFNIYCITFNPYYKTFSPFIRIRLLIL